jgi:hypothetical protein
MVRIPSRKVWGKVSGLQKACAIEKDCVYQERRQWEYGWVLYKD